MPQHYVTKLARDDGTIVVQVGEGADEILHGYKGYADHRRFVVPLQRYVPQLLRRPIGSAAIGVSTRLGRGIRHGEALYDASRSSQPYWGGALCFRGPLKTQITTNGHVPDAYRHVERIWQEAGRRRPGADLFQRISYVELKQRLPELLLMRLDNVAMASSVEGREPFLDHELVAYALALVLGSALKERDLLDYGVADRIFAAHKAGRGDWSKHLWTLYSVSAWYDRWIAGRT